jgi:hypothetical protein
MVIEGTLKSVSMAYGNQREEAIEFFLARGWEVSSEWRANRSRGEYNDYITFKAGADAHKICLDDFDFPNANIVTIGHR